MPNYQNGKIYSIRSHLTDDVYIGSTIETLSNRMAGHKKYYKKWLITKKRYTTSFEIINKDPENCYIELVELYPCNSKIELHRREGEIIRTTNCVNKNIAGRTQKEWFEENKQILAEKSKIYRQTNKQSILEKNKQYRQTNKQKILEKAKQMYENNKQSTIEQRKQYRDNNKVKINEQKRRYHEENKEQINKKKKEYYNNNKEQFKEKAKQYYENNKQQLLEQQKQFYENNKEQLLEKYKQKYTCECGSTLRKTDKSQHIKTKKHQTFINSN